MTVETKPKLRLREIDMLYALGTLLVILGHSHPNDWSTFPGKWIEFIYTFPWYITTPAMFAVGVIFPTAVIFIYRKCTFLHRRPIKLILGMR